MKRSAGAAWLLGAAVAAGASAQAPARPALANVRYEEDWSRLGDADRTDPFDVLKARDLGHGWTLTAGGSLRLRLESDEGRTLAAGPLRDDVALKGRAFMHVGLARGGFRWFAEARMADVWGSDRPKPAVDHDDPDLQNFFVEWSRRFESSSSILVRAGRQELTLGAERLVSPLDWSGTRRTFDGISLIVTRGKWKTQVFATQPVDHEPHDADSAIDDRFLHGIHAIGRLAGGHVVEPYFYWLEDGRGLATDEDDGERGDVTRRTWGVRWRAGERAWLSDLELSFQEGRAADDPIRAWSASWTGTRIWSGKPWKPRLGVGIDVATGDSSPTDGRVDRFDQLYPLGHAYFGHVDLVGRQNVEGLRVQLDLQPGKAVTLSLALHRFGLEAERDALWTAAGVPVRRDPDGESGSHAGSEVDLLASWRIGAHQRVSAEICRWWSGEFVENTGPGGDAWFAWAAWELKF